MIKGVFLDFYGTVVHEDGVIVQDICEHILRTSRAADISQIKYYWWEEFQNLFSNSFCESFCTQRALEHQSIVNTLQHFCSTESAEEICKLMFERWEKPPLFEDAKVFMDRCPVPVYIVSNIDINDIKKAIDYHGLKPARVFTSEEARAYKPRKELFELALRETGLLPEDIVHIGDSFSSDVRGAKALGIPAIWLNRYMKAAPEEVLEVEDLLKVFDTVYFK